MTDLTDQDRRVAHEWAASIDPDMKCWSDRERAAARVILATVEAQAPTLTEELRHIAEHWEEWATDTITSAIRAAADRADQTEQERDEARAEVERLTGERFEKEVRDTIDAHYDNYAAQKDAESNAETPDPADVKPGEAWIVEVNGKRGTAMKDGDSLMPWSVVTDGTFSSRDAGEITLVSRLVPAPRVITNPDGLNRAKRLTVIRDGVGIVCERAALGDGWFTTGIGVDQTTYIQLPATVLWEPGA